MRQSADLTQFATTTADSIDFAALLKRCLGRTDLMARIVATFRTAVVKEIGELTDALTTQDRTAVLAISHRLKGTCLTASAEPLAHLAERLHFDAEQGEPYDGLEVRELLATELNNLLMQIRVSGIGETA